MVKKVSFTSRTALQQPSSRLRRHADTDTAWPCEPGATQRQEQANKQRAAMAMVYTPAHDGVPRAWDFSRKHTHTDTNTVTLMYTHFREKQVQAQSGGTSQSNRAIMC